MALGGDQQLGTATLDVRADTTGLKRDLAEAKRETTKAANDLKKGLDKASKVAGVALLGLGAAAFKATQNASDLGESMNKARQTFGAAAKDMPGMMGSVADSLGMARAEALDNAAGIGAMLIPMGLSQREAARMSARMTTLAADLGSFHNADPTDMLDRLRAGLSGESEPLKRFGIVLNETRVAQEAYRMGIAQTGAVLTDSEKLQARYSLAIRDAGAANGDFARTSGGLANQQRILKSEVADLSATFGQVFIPIAGAVVGVLRDATGWMENNRTTALALAGVVGGLALTVLTVNAAVKTMGAVTAASTALQSLFITRTVAATVATEGQAVAQTGLNTAMRANVVGIVITAVALLAAGLVVAYKKSETFRTVVGNAMQAVGAAAEVAKTVILGVVTALKKLLGIGTSIKEFFDDIRGKSDTTAKDVATGLGKVAQAARGVSGSAKGAARDYVKGLQTMTDQAGTVAAVNTTLGRSTEKLADTFARKWQGSADKAVTSLTNAKPKATTAGTGVGTGWMQGIQQGITSQQGVLNAAFARAVDQAVAAGKAEAEAHSPSKKVEREVGQPMAAGLYSPMERPETKKRLALAMTGTVREAVRSAKANVPSLMGGLANAVGQAIDAQLAKGMARLDAETGPEAAGLRAMQAARDANQQARTLAGLNKAITDAAAAGNAAGPEGETPEQRTQRLTQAQQQLADAVVALNDYQADQAIAAEERRLATLRTQLETEATERRTKAEDTLTQLGDKFARGGFTSAKAFTKQLNDALGDAKVPLADMGKLLGEAFRKGFMDTKGGLIDQVVAALVGPQAKGNPLAPDVVRPLALQHAEWAAKRKDLSDHLADLRKAAATAGSPGGTKITSEEQNAITRAAAALATWDQREPKARKLGFGGIVMSPTYGLLAERGYPEAAITLDGSRRSWQLLADAHAMMPGANGASAGPLVHVAHMEVRQPEDAQLVAARLSRNLATRGVGAT